MARLVRQEAHHQVLQQAARVPGEVDIGAARGVGGLLEEWGGGGEFGDGDGDPQALRGEDGVHDWDVLVGEVGGDGEDEDAGVDGWRGF